MMLLVFILVCISVVNITVNEHLFTGVRTWVSRWPKLYNFMTCKTCWGFWVGFGISFLFPPLHPVLMLSSIFYALISSISNNLIERLFFKF